MALTHPIGDVRRHGLPILSTTENEGCVHHREMTERLRKVSELAPGLRIVLFGEQSEIVARARGALEGAHGVLAAAHHRVNTREPERAREEDAFVSGEPIDVSLRLEAEEE